MSFGVAFKPSVMNTMLNNLGGPALPTQFSTLIWPPAGLMTSPDIVAMLGSGYGAVVEYLLSGAAIAGALNLSVMTEKASIPGKGFATSPVIMHGQHRLMPYALNHETFKMTFICTNSMVERTFFDIWMQHIQKPDSHYMEYFDNYKGTIWIKKLCGSGLFDGQLADFGSSPTLNEPLVELGSALSTYYLEEAYPVRVGAQELSAGDTQSYLTLDVEFAYTHSRCLLDKLVPAIFKGPEESLGDLIGMGPAPKL